VTRRLERLVRATQAEHRVPAIAVALHRGDRPLWTFQVGTAGGGVTLDADTQFRIGSVTKTFTAVLVMQCRDAGLLDLDDPIGAHLDLPAHTDLTIRRLLSHTSGLQREPYGDIWDTLATPSLEQTIAELARAERVLPPGQRVHYSNLGFALLGHLVAKLRGGTWEEVLHEYILRPLQLNTVTLQPGPNAATGYLVDAFSDHARPEPRIDLGGIAPAAQLWATATDMARWAAFLVDPATVNPNVLSPDTVAEMRLPQAVRDPQEWNAGFGLGLIITPREGRVVDVGHGGAMPGFLAEVFGRTGGSTPPATGVAVLLSSGTAGNALGLGKRLVDTALKEDPPDIEPWVPGEAAPEEYRSVLGYWWSEGFPYVFRWRKGRLEASAPDAPPGTPPAVFTPEEGTDLLRTVSGREQGELLRLSRDAQGRVVRMHWATYRFTREQQAFDGIPASEP